MRRSCCNRFTMVLAAVACIPLVGVAEEMILSEAQLDAVTAAGAVDRPTGIVVVEANARGEQTDTFVKSLAHARASESSGLPSGVGTVFVSTYGVSYARTDDGPDSSVSAIANGVNEQPGRTSGPSDLRVVATTRFSQIAIYSAKSYSSPVLNRTTGWSSGAPYR